VVVVAPAGANAASVAEHSLGLALALARRTVSLDRLTRSGEWRRSGGHELAGKTWGLLGAGATGRACARVAKALGMDVIGHDPYVPADHPEVRELGLRMVGLHDLASGADVLSCHLPATPETKGLVDAGLLARMRRHALLISVGRGEVVDEGALVTALDEGRLGGAGLDVRASEPPVTGRLEELPNVVLTPHIAGITAESQERIMSILATDITHVLEGRAAEHAAGSVRSADR
jgi:D-3-phosphoglycerate dehydrogenase / 2-oxoglutarate reductase